jgi:RimJ/RimL family protein N-acetyltransferase
MFANRGGSPLSFDRISRADIDIIADLELEPEQVERYLGPIRDIQAAVLRNPACAITGMTADGDLVGFYVLHADQRDNACWWLGWLAFDRRHQNRGYGRVAMVRIMATMRRIVGCRRVRLLVDPANTSALRLYAKAGFRQTGLRRRGELVLEAAVFIVVAVENVVASLRASSVSKRARRMGRLRLSHGPHAGWVIGVERGPPATAW